MRLAFSLFLLGSLLTGCVNSQSMPAPTPTIYKPIVSTATVLATSTAVPTPTLTPIPAYREIEVSFTREYTLLEGFVDHPSSLVWSADGKTLIVASQQNYLVYFDTQSNTATIKPVEDWAISTIALSPNSKILAVNSDSRFIESASVSFINLETGEMIRTISVDKPFVFEGQTGIVYGSAGIFAPDGRIFILNSGKQVTLWDVTSGSQSKELYKSDSNSLILGLFLNSAKNLLFARQCKISECSNEATFLRWDTNSWELTKTFTGDFFGFSFSPDGDTFTPIYKDINIVHSNNVTELFNFTGSHSLGIYSGRLIAYDPSGKYIAVGNRGYAVIYEAYTGRLVRWLLDFDPEILEFSPDGAKLAAGGGSERPGLVAIWDLTQP